jgi:uncharacterized protein YdhG (YjbR/CyaY superfamily)
MLCALIGPHLLAPRRGLEATAAGSSATKVPTAGALQRAVKTDRQVGTMADRSTAGTIEEYIAGFPAATQTALREVRAIITAAAPDATESISYAIPTFDLNGRHLVHFAGYERHVGFYPIPSGMEAFEEELKSFKRGKGSVQFPLDRPLPADLIRRIVEFRVEENLARTSK